MSGVPSPGSAYNVFKAPLSSFPLNDPCEKNWLIIFTAGDDSSEYSSAQAVADLYNYTKDNALTKLKKAGGGSGDNEFEPIKLQDGVRTLVVGFVADPVNPNDSSDPVVILRNKLQLMAEAGDPGNPDAKAFFANDVRSLINAMRSVLARINNEIQPAKGSMLESDSFSEENYDGGLDADIINLYAGSYQINIYDQWKGKLSRYVASKDKDTSEIRSNMVWELSEKLISARSADAGGRNLYFWAGSSHRWQKPAYTLPGSFPDNTPHPMTVAPYNVNLVPPLASMDATMLTYGPTSWANRTHPSRALVNWYYGWELAYAAADTQHARRYMLSDTGMSGISKVGAPEAVDSLPGFRTYAQAVSALDPPVEIKLYFQSNDGLLHVVDARTGAEEKALLPPPSLLPYRLFGLKARRTPANGLYKWINVDGYLVTTSDDIPITSIPSFTLDGPAQVRYFDFGSSLIHDWRPYMIATLGRGGGGIYAMDVSDSTDPDFMWYHENYEDDQGRIHLFSQHRQSGADPAETVITKSAAGWDEVYDNPDAHPYEQLGFNSPKPYFGVARHEETHADPNGFYNIIALSGGLQNYLDLTKNGAMGSALYLIDPDVKYHNGSEAGGARVFNSGSLAGANAKWRNDRDGFPGIGVPDPYMGMMTSEPIFLAAASIGNNWIADGLFACDNRGNIFFVSFTDPETDRPLPRSSWQIRTVASLRKSGDNLIDSYSIPAGVVAGSRMDRAGVVWIAGGTSNVGGRGHSDAFDAMIRNKEQMIFCFKMPELREPTDGMTYRDGRGGDNPGLWTSLDADDAKSEMNASNGDEGWYIPLRKATAGYNAEYVTTRPIMFGGNLYAATFREKVIDSESDKLCESGEVLGESRLYAIEMDSGKAGMWDGGEKKYLTFDGIKITGFTTSMTGRPTLFITYNILDRAAANLSINSATDGEKYLSRSEGDLDFMSLTLTDKSDNPPPITSNDGVINYWRYYEDR
jgi:hypothetical protein